MRSAGGGGAALEADEALRGAAAAPGGAPAAAPPPWRRRLPGRLLLLLLLPVGRQRRLAGPRHLPLRARAAQARGRRGGGGRGRRAHAAPRQGWVRDGRRSVCPSIWPSLCPRGRGWGEAVGAALRHVGVRGQPLARRAGGRLRPSRGGQLPVLLVNLYIFIFTYQVHLLPRTSFFFIL